jgi:hypothetical protein
MNIVYGLLIFGLVMTGIGGILDIFQQDRFLGLSKYHYWNDGMLLVLIAGVIAIMKKDGRLVG